MTNGVILGARQEKNNTSAKVIVDLGSLLWTAWKSESVCTPGAYRPLVQEYLHAARYIARDDASESFGAIGHSAYDHCRTERVLSPIGELRN